MSRNKNYDILDGILNDSKRGRGQVVWQPDSNHPNGGYYIEVADCHDLSTKLSGTMDDLERAVRSMAG